MWRVALLSWWLLGTLALCCPPDCRCFTDDDGYKVANCSRSGLLTGGLLPTIDVLNFKNQLRGSQTKLEARIFRNFRGLQVLNLHNSSISHLPNDVFLGIGRVVRIDLSFNKIKHLNGVVFKPLQNLKELNLRGNSLSMSPLEVVVSDTLEQLDMGYCNIISLPLYTFSSVPSLRHLILDGNSIQTIEYNVLPKGLTYINLASNHIVEPPINVFNSLRYLFRLDISQNPINCSCALLAFQDSLSGRAGVLENGVTCANSPHLFGRTINSVNENQLCRHDYNKKKGSNYLAHSRSMHHHHHYDIQSDEPLMGDESYGTRDAAEVMFTNDETNQMGTHMEARMSHLGVSTNDKNLQTEDDTTVTSDKEDTSADADPTQDLEIDHPSSPELNEDDTSPEESKDSETTGRDSVPSSIRAEDLQHATEESYSGNDNVIDLSSSDPLGGTSDHSNTLHALDVGYNVTDSAHGKHKWSSSEQELDAKTLLTTPLGDEPSSNLELAPDETTTETSRDSSGRFTLPTSANEAADYSYDSQHDEYGDLDNVTRSDYTEENSPDDSEKSSSSTSSPPEELEDNEGSGELEIQTSSEPSASSSTVGFMEEQETETEPSLQTVSDDLAEASSTTSYSELLSSSTEVSSIEPPTDYSTDASTEPSEPSSSETSSIEPTTEASSSEHSTEPDMTDAPISSSTDQSSTPEETTEPSTESSTEPTTDVPMVDISSEVSSTDPTPVTDSSSTTSSPSSSSSGYWWESDEEQLSPSSSTASTLEDLTMPTNRKSKMLEFTTEADKDNEIEVVKTFEESAKNGKITVDPNNSDNQKNYLASGITFILIGVLIAIIVVLLTVIMCKKKKKKTTTKVRLPSVDPEAANGTELQDMLLPKPPENGIKVLPKPYTNGTTPVSNGKATKELEADKEETIPVLAPEPEPDPEPVWDDKPEPIEAVTARLTMLARPQTPMFIQKSLT